MIPIKNGICFLKEFFKAFKKFYVNPIHKLKGHNSRNNNKCTKFFCLL